MRASVPSGRSLAQDEVLESWPGCACVSPDDATRLSRSLVKSKNDCCCEIKDQEHEKPSSRARVIGKIGRHCMGGSQHDSATSDAHKRKRSLTTGTALAVELRVSEEPIELLKVLGLQACGNYSVRYAARASRTSR